MGYTASMSDPSGNLEIQLRRSPDGLDCTIVSTRPVRAASVFVGYSPEETSARLPRLFSICARAQAGACAEALEQASGLKPNPGAREWRHAAIAAETIREHLWRILLDWPLLSGEPPKRSEMAAVLALSNRIIAHLDPSGALFRPGVAAAPPISSLIAPAVADLTDLLTQQVLGMPPDAWLSRIVDAAAFERWCRRTDTAAARLMQSLLDSGEASLGRTDVPVLPGIPDADLISRMCASDAAAFIARPTWHGEPCETSPFTRGLGTPLIQSLVEHHGAGLLARLGAQLVEVAAGLPVLVADSSASSAAAGRVPTAAKADGMGLGRANAARGLLVHLAGIADSRVCDYRILAPTEWNFHPHGVVARALSALPASPEASLRRQAELLITAIDPCVAFKLTLS
jgi:hypothetical protein